MRIIGITGGVGSGKSRILQYMAKERNAYIIEADKLAHELMQKGRSVYRAITEAFSEYDILTADGEIDRKKMADIVFSSSERLQLLDSLTHPRVKEEILRQIEEQRHQGTRYLVIEAALLIQDGYKEICDEMWFIQVPKEERMIRLAAQRGYTREKCVSVMAKQPEDTFFIENSDFVIVNLDFSDTITQVCSILDRT